PVPVPTPKPEPAPTPPPPPPAAEPVKIVLEDIHFDFDKATLTKAAKEILARAIATLKENPGVKVQIEGHTCAHGTEDYNMALGERRANAVKEYLVNEGIAADRITTISYGETRLSLPETPTSKNKESKEAKANRRVHFETK
ncbi:MAG: OmpA family protein, partial [Thermodesulfovibrionales bacterium]